LLSKENGIKDRIARIGKLFQEEIDNCGNAFTAYLDHIYELHANLEKFISEFYTIKELGERVVKEFNRMIRTGINENKEECGKQFKGKVILN
jgi:hypothetical protein